MASRYDVAIIGAGVVGAAVAREFSRYKLSTVLIDKGGDVAEGISKANSGVIHSGFNVKHGSLKAKLNNEGLFLLPKIAEELGVEYRICKKLVVAKDDYEKKYLEKLFEQGLKNNTPGLSIIDGSLIKKLEPEVNGKWALFSECTGIITPYLLTIALAESACKNGVKVLLNTEVCNIIRNENNTFTLFSREKKVICSSKWVINCAGLYSDKIAGILESSPAKIYPCRGEYYILDKDSKKALSLAVYPVPPKDGSGLGVHLTPTMNGNILLGPSAEYIRDRDDVSNTRDVMDTLKKEAFELMPSLKQYAFIKNYSGIRPKLFSSVTGSAFEDFYIQESSNISNFVNLLGIESPGLTAAPAIAKYVVENIIATKKELTKKDFFDPTWNRIIRTSELSFDKLGSLIQEDADYGELICRCEQVSRKEIIQAINNPLGVKTLNGIKKRTHSMMGRCQGGFCFSRIGRILIDEFGLKPEEVVKNSPNSNMFVRD